MARGLEFEQPIITPHQQEYKFVLLQCFHAQVFVVRYGYLHDQTINVADVFRSL